MRNINNPPIRLLDDTGQSENNGGDCETVELELDILGETVEFAISAETGQAKLSDIVPVARKLSTKLTLMVLDDLRENQRHVPCRKGCSACCSFLIALSVPEAFRFMEEVTAMPTERGEEVMRLCLDTARTTLSERPPDFVRNESAETALPDQKTQLSKWGAGLKLACPLLSDCICTLYTDRPIVCREHIVTGSAVKCETEVADEPQIVPMPVSILECLGELAAELEQSEIECVMLPLALPWAQDNLERSERTWSAVAMVECFGEIVKAKASEKSAAVIAEIQHSHF